MQFSQKDNFTKIQNSLKDSSLGFALGAFVVLGVFIYALYGLADWSNPTASPTGGNVTPPIFTGSTALPIDQTKYGTLKLGTTSPSIVSNFFVYNGKVAIASSSLGAASLLVSSPSAPNVNVIDADGNRVVGLATIPINNNEAASKYYVDWAASSSKFWSGTLGGNIWNMNTGNVGIGTTNPGAKLEVDGYVTGQIWRDETDLPNNYYLQLHGNNPVNGTIGWQYDIINGGTTYSSILNLNKNGVGIGTTNPGGALEIISSADNFTNQGFSNNLKLTAQYWPAILLNRTYDNTGYLLGEDGNGFNFMSVASGIGTTRLIVQNGGNVGIGTTNPLFPLQVEGATARIHLHSTTATNAAFLSFSNTPGAYFGIENSAGTAFTTNGGLPYAFVMNQSGAYPLQLGTNDTTRVTILSGGNVGIGTTNPMATLHVSGGAQPVIRAGGTSGGEFDLAKEGSFYYALIASAVLGTNDLSIYSGATSHYDFVIKQNDNIILDGGGAYGSGSVGIGSTNPAETLTVNGPIGISLAGAGLGFESGTFAITKFIEGYGIRYVGDATHPFQVSTAASLLVGYNAAGANYGAGNAYISGNVGVGTTAATAKLTVAGAAGISDIFDVASSTTTNVLRVTKSGDLLVAGQITAGSGDVAEEFYTDKNYPAGTVLVMDDQGYKSARACDKNYDQTVIGVISEKPGMVIGQVEGKFVAPVALTGVVKVLVNATGGKIQPGDLLTTSAVSGEAMKAINPKVGTAIGKALEADTGKGWVMALVNLK